MTGTGRSLKCQTQREIVSWKWSESELSWVRNWTQQETSLSPFTWGMAVKDAALGPELLSLTFCQSHSDMGLKPFEFQIWISFFILRLPLRSFAYHLTIIKPLKYLEIYPHHQFSKNSFPLSFVLSIRTVQFDSQSECRNRKRLTRLRVTPFYFNDKTSWPCNPVWMK